MKTKICWIICDQDSIIAGNFAILSWWGQAYSVWYSLLINKREGKMIMLFVIRCYSLEKLWQVEGHTHHLGYSKLFMSLLAPLPKRNINIVEKYNPHLKEMQPTWLSCRAIGLTSRRSPVQNRVSAVVTFGRHRPSITITKSLIYRMSSCIGPCWVLWTAFIQASYILMPLFIKVEIDKLETWNISLFSLQSM